jgi:hypothetical protein
MMRIFEDLLHASEGLLHAFEDQRRRRGIVLHAFEHCRQAWSGRT